MPFEYGEVFFAAWLRLSSIVPLPLAWLSFKRPYKIFAGVGERT